jgi:methyl-galactoside transport system substrate-binding protein
MIQKMIGRIKMKMLKKILIISMVTVMMIVTLADCSKKAVSTISEPEKPVKVAVFLLDFTDDYISLVRQNLEDIQKENEGKVEFTFYDGKSDQAIQNEEIDKVLEEGTDLILLNLISYRDSGTVKTVINKIKETNTPVILFNREPLTTDAIKSYVKALYIGTDAKQAGILQGKMLVDAWNTNKEAIDKNRDNIMQYVMLEGERGNIEAIARTKYSVLTIQQAEIKTEELALRFADWNTELARNAIESLLLKYGDKIEVIMANDDSMAIGAIQALQAHGFNKVDKTKTIAVVGADAIPEARDLISKGIMLGSVVQDPRALAEALYIVGMNLVYNKDPLEGTQYKFDDTGVSIRIPHTEYINK